MTRRTHLASTISTTSRSHRAGALAMEEPRLKPFIVLKSDPRWDAFVSQSCRRLVDFGATSASVGLDSEILGMPRAARGGRGRQGRTFKRDDNFDPLWSCRLRCLQVGLPSGLVFCCWISGIADGLTYR